MLGIVSFVGAGANVVSLLGVWPDPARVKERLRQGLVAFAVGIGCSRSALARSPSISPAARTHVAVLMAADHRLAWLIPRCGKRSRSHPKG
jgi:hypothetical protein